MHNDGLMTVARLTCGKELRALSKECRRYYDEACRSVTLNSRTSSMPLDRFPQLRKLVIKGCDVTPVMMGMLSTGNCVHLMHLDVDDTNIETLAFAKGCPRLAHLSCKRTNVGDLLALANLADLEHLDVAFTPVASLEGLENKKKLRHVNVSRSRVCSLRELSACEMLDIVMTSHTHVSDITPLSRSHGLRVLDIKSTRVRELDALSDLVDLEELDMSGLLHTISLAPLSYCKSLQRVTMGRTQITDMSALRTSAAKMWMLDVSGTSVTTIAMLSEPRDVLWCMLRDLDLGLTSLMSLPNNLSDAFPALYSLSIMDTHVSDLDPLRGLKTLAILDVSGTWVESLEPLRRCGSLRQLAFNRTQVDTVEPLVECSRLESISCCFTCVVDLAVLSGRLRWLFNMSAACTDVQTLAADMPRLQHVCVSNSPIKAMTEFATCTSLVEVNCARTDITEIGVLIGCAQSLRYLDINHTGVADISVLEHMNTLYFLDISNTNVWDISALRGCRNLSVLKMDGAPVRDLSSLRWTRSLEQLDIAHTKVVDISVVVENCSSLSVLDVRGCALDDAQILNARTAVDMLLA